MDCAPSQLTGLRDAPHAASPPTAIPFTFPGITSVRCLFTTSPFGNLAYPRDGTCREREEALLARKRLLAKAGVGAWVELHQVHGDELIREPLPTPLDAPSTIHADGSCTSRLGLGLAVKTADCQPILLAAKSGSAIAALHVGWRGNAICFPTSGVERFCRQYALDPASVMAVRGPSLGPGAAQFINFEREWPAAFAPWFDPRSRTMDLWSLTRHQLLQAGLLPEHIFSLDLCTRSLPEMFFSHRLGHAGRQVSLIWITAS